MEEVKERRKVGKNEGGGKQVEEVEKVEKMEEVGKDVEARKVE